MAVALVVGVCNLLSKLLAHTFIVLSLLSAARAITPVRAYFAAKHLYNLAVFVVSNLHILPPVVYVDIILYF